MRPATRSGMRQGRRLLCRYHGDPLWHERFVLLPTSKNGAWCIVTPDSDIYIEDYDDATVFGDVRLIPMTGGKPQGLTGSIYPFRAPPSAEEKAAWQVVAEREVSVFDREQPLPMDDDAVLSTAWPSEPAPPAAPGAAAATDLPAALAPRPRPSAPAVTGMAWVAERTSSDGSVVAGSILDGNYQCCIVTDFSGAFFLNGGGIVSGALVSLMELGERQRVAVKLEEIQADMLAGGHWERASSTTPRGPAERPLPDARILDVLQTSGGRRTRDWSSVANSCEQIDMQAWPIEGPRAALWVVQFLASAANGGPDAYHRWWRSVTKLSTADWGVAEHQQLCRYLGLAGFYDNLDLSNLAVMEAITRRFQLIEYQYRQRSRDAQRGGAQGGAASATLTGLAVMDGQEADLFDGIGRLDSVVCVAPALLAHISEELRKTSEIDKQARKAREERAQLRGELPLVAPALTPIVPQPKREPKGKGAKGAGKE